MSDRARKSLRFEVTAAPTAHKVLILPDELAKMDGLVEGAEYVLVLKSASTWELTRKESDEHGTST